MIRAQAQGRCFSFSAVVIISVLFLKISKAEGDLYAEVGTNFTLTCTSSGNPVWWSINGRNITEKDERYSITEEAITENDKIIQQIDENQNLLAVQLFISNVKLLDEGNFTCHKTGPDTDESYYLQPVVPAKITRHNDPKIRIKISQSVVLYCLIEAYPAEKFKGEVKWHKEENSHTDLNNKTQIRLLNSTHINTTLEITDVFKKDNGTYVCTSNFFKQVSKELALLVLDVPQVSIDFAKAVGASKIFLNWTVNDGNDPIETYFVQHMAENSSTFDYYNGLIHGKNTSFVLENFKPNTKYKIKMSAKNKNGQGVPHSYPYWIQTLEKDPVFIPNVEVTGSTSSTITIGWQPPPKELLDYIQYYKIVISEAENNAEKKEAIHVQNSRNLPYMFDELKTATAYSFRVRACCELTGVCGPWSETVNGSTTDGAASAPVNLKVSCSHFNISRRNTVSVSWDPPVKPNGKIINYHVVLEGMSTFRSEKGEYKNETYGPEVKNPFETKSIFERVFPNMNYTVRVSGTTRQKKMGEQAEASCTMPVTVPDNIGRIAWGKIKTEDDRWVFKLYLPRFSERNGPICCYRIFLVRMSEYNRDLPPPEDLDIQTYHEVHSQNNTRGGAYLAEMFPSEDFRPEIFLGDGKRMIPPEESIKTADEVCRKCFEGIPFRRRIKKIIKTTTTTTTTEKPKEIEQIIPEKTQREQLNKAGNLTEAASNILEKRKRRSQEDIHPNVNEVVTESTTASSILATNIDLEVFDGLIDTGSNYTGFVELAVKNNNEGGDKVLFAYSGYFEMISPSATAENYDDSDNMSLIVNIVVQVFCALILLVLILLSALWLVHRYYSKHSVQGEEVISLRDSLSRALCGGRTSNHRHLIGSALTKPTDIGPISKIDLPQAYINRHKDTDYGFLREYEMLPNRFNDRTTKNSDVKENSHKNRYPDIKAYDQTRVKISMINSMQGSDYINANFVIGYKERKKFICAQGPMDSTIIDFWRMIWEQHLEIIVMLTNLEEYNKAKCAKYWPEKILDTKQFGDITVVFASEQRFSDYLVRNLDIFRKNGNGEDEEEERHITQYHYLVWKDFMAPEHPHGIIKFIRQINNVYSVQRGPILVHCSAGVGRTGTLVALDSLIQQLEEEGQVSIFNTVCDLRHQRNFLVQSLKQYIFLYRALLDIAQFGNTELQARGLSATVEALKQKPNDSKEKCKLELQFEKIKSIADETNKSCAVGSGKENQCKNRSELVIPFDRNRVILTPIPSREHSTYINASFIEGYDNSESFIITQDPLENTIGDFWRMISEQGITTLVMISEIGDGIRRCPRYWADDEIQYDHILVKYMHSESCPYYTRREFNVTNCKIDDTIKVTQFQYNGWPTVEGEVPEVCRGIIELVDQAQKHHNSENNFSTPSPIAVHCSLGTDRSSIFVAMCILVQQLRTEKKVDICTTTRKLRSQRSLLLDTYAQYEFLHRAIVNYADLHKLSLESPSDC